MKNIIEGSTVTLKSGGPVMNVDRIFRGIGGQLKANCVWNSSGGEPFERTYSLSVLVAVDPDHNKPKFSF